MVFGGVVRSARADVVRTPRRAERTALNRALLAFAALCALSALLFARPHATPGPALRDFESYYAAGATWLRAENPYGTAIWKSERTIPGVDPARYELLPFVGPPAFLPIWALLARLPFRNAAAVWTAVLIASLVLVLNLTLRIAGRRVNVESFICVGILALGFGPITSDIALGQVALVAFACALLACATAGRNVWGAAAAALFAGLQPNVALVLLARFRKKSVMLACGVAVVVFAGACALAVGPGALAAYGRLLHDHGNAERFSLIQITPAAIAYGFGASAAVASAVGIVIAAASIAAWIVVAVITGNPFARLAAACAVLPFAVPFFHEHDLLIVFVPALYAVTRADGRFVPVAVAGGLFAAVDWLGIAQRPDGLLQSALLGLAAFCALVCMAERPSARTYLAAAIPLILLPIAGFAATHDPAPIWPDAMRVLPSFGAGVSAATVWAAEQRASGLLAPNAFWALLRCGPLLGCAMLLIAIAGAAKYPRPLYCRTGQRSQAGNS
ncbi:MAG: DUF2029 domain-containing protein [Candidatus Eremiobacteraeota bacterium]|nr:DUF2029 domain-containing protein [Candidatus Eremiobacteraeota bacterium]